MVLVGVTLIFRTLRREVVVVRQQSNFLAAVSHELKSPLASIRLYTETLQLRDVDASTRQRYLGIMRADIDRLETLVGNLLAVARLDHGEYKGHPQHVDVTAEVRHVVDDMAEEMRARGAAVRVTGPDAALMAYVDPAILTTVMRNILDNAAKYNQHNAPVDISLQQEAETIVICVTDRGIGLESAELTRIFKKFYRVGDEMVRQTEGSGLGLYLVDALWRQSGGRVRALSDGVGRGTTFELRVPGVMPTGTTV
jgi:signal transduction histidine kinase